jgi:hypothetical protein
VAEFAVCLGDQRSESNWFFGGSISTPQKFNLEDDQPIAPLSGRKQQFAGNRGAGSHVLVELVGIDPQVQFHDDLRSFSTFEEQDPMEIFLLAIVRYFGIQIAIPSG